MAHVLAWEIANGIVLSSSTENVFQYVDSGGTAANTTIDSGCLQVVSSGGSAINANHGGPHRGMEEGRAGIGIARR